MSMLRAFIAVEIPTEIQQKIHRETANLRKAIDSLVRWVPSQNMHLTLKFLGDVSPNSLEFIKQMLRTEAENVPCFDIHLAGLGAFPNLKRPRVLYVRIQAPAVLDALARRDRNRPRAGLGMSPKSVPSLLTSHWDGSDKM